MIREKWNDSWVVELSAGNPLTENFTGDAKQGKEVCLPHDAMIYEEKTQTTKNGHQTGYYPGKQYCYKRKFHVPKEWEYKTVIFELEGVYRNARVYINGDYAGGDSCGYSNFYVCADDFLKYGEENDIKVIANNSAESNSRWYSGSGIYRNVNIMVGNLLHIKTDGLRITTPEIEDDTATVAVDTTIVNQLHTRKQIIVHTKIQDMSGTIVAEDKIPVTMFADQNLTCRQRIFIDRPQLWDCDHPYLYLCSTKLMELETVIDEEISSFGIRTLSLNAKKGFQINRNHVLLRGACIHHDNGIIGSCTLERAEERRCQQLKAAGFNCIRSSHHPISKAMLDACDREGMLVFDELSDVWTRSKNLNDYAQNFVEFWERDVESMVSKDFNHPSVIIYSTGNEMQEAGTAKGAELNRAITNKIRSLDGTRYITSAINGLLAGIEHMGEIMRSIKGTEKAYVAQKETNSKGGGSDELNSMMSVLHGPLADAMAVSPILTNLIDEYVSALDIAGYNYLTARHAMEHELNPNRVVLGTETFPADIARLWKIVKENKHVIGDMTWAGYDYLGEAGIGVHYYDGRHGFGGNWPFSVAYIGDIDLIGYRRPISYYREIVYGLRTDPYIAVERLNHYGEKATTTPWMWKDEIASWTWNGFEGKPAIVHVYAVSDEIELLLNGKSLGRKPAGESHEFTATFELSYEPGELIAVGYQDGVKTGGNKLVTASSDVTLDVNIDRNIIKADGADLAYILVGLTDEMGNQNIQISKKIAVQVKGNGTLQGYGSADPGTENSYDSNEWETYDGYVLAVIRASKEPGEIMVTFTLQDGEYQTVTIQTVAEEAEL